MEKTRQLLRETAVVILCGGQGSRMRSNDRHKACFPVDGVPAINRAVRMFRRHGARRIVLVVGAMAESVMETVGAEFPETLYACQSEQLGTGHAARIGVAALGNFPHDGPVLITMGDKVIEPHVIADLAEQFTRSRADLVFVSGPKKRGGDLSGAGRVVVDRSRGVLGIVEVRDIQRARILASATRRAQREPKAGMTYENLLAVGRRFIRDKAKLEKALGTLPAEIRRGEGASGHRFLKLLGPEAGQVRVGGGQMEPRRLERNARTVNLSVYLARREFWERLLPRLRNDNAQREYYLTDVVSLAAEDTRPWKRIEHELDDPDDVMGFNSPDELLRIEDVFRRRSLKPDRGARRPAVDAAPGPPRGMFRSAGKWLEMFDRWTPGLRRKFRNIYGDDDALARTRRDLFRKALKLFVERFGPDRKAILVRAPGRLNLLGRHIDHRGGALNVMAIDREAVFVAAAREDDTVTLCNVESGRFPDRRFSVSELLGDVNWDDWLTFVDSDHVRAMLERDRGDWSNYVKAALLRLQQRFRTVRIRGFDAAVAGDIPMAAGLSSSSALVVASAEAAVAFNDLDIAPIELVDLCGEGEWFVGSRGGAGDHSAIRLGRRGRLTHVKFMPFRVGEAYDLPADCKVMIAHSGVDAHKSAAAKDRFNQKVAAYELGFMLLKDRLPEHAALLEHLRDLNPRHLDCPPGEIYRCLLKVPEAMTPQALRKALSKRHGAKLERVFASHRRPRAYDLRGVLLFGVAECERSLLAPELLKKGRVEEFGRLMLVSHDGDRAARFVRGSNGVLRKRRYAYDCSDAALNGLREDLRSEQPERVLAAQLHNQPGAYGCSIPQIDKMIDVARDLPGVHGAQLGGAGLGGCVMILARADAVDAVAETLRKDCYAPGADPLIHVCQPVAGSGPLIV
jgi:N-acetylgalactosamine kinase